MNRRTFKRATDSVPVVMAVMSDPVEEGLVASLAHPGGNFTGLAFQNPDADDEGPRAAEGSHSGPLAGRGPGRLDHGRHFRLPVANGRTVVQLAARRRLPATYDNRTFVEVGGLMSYGPSFPDMYRRAASYADQILKGAGPGDLPVQQATKFDLAINLRPPRP